jgi:hypothetical protein
MLCDKISMFTFLGTFPRIWKNATATKSDNDDTTTAFFKKALTVLRGPLACHNGRLDLHIETFGRTPLAGGSVRRKASTDTGQHNTETLLHVINIYVLHLVLRTYIRLNTMIIGGR